MSYATQVNRKQVSICSWNIRGLGDPRKRAAALSMVRSYGVSILCLQETHLTTASIPRLGWGEFALQYHSVYSSFSRGVSILINAGITFNCIHSKIDDRGRYIFLHCKVENTVVLLANVYIPPPFDTDVLLDLVEFVLVRPGLPVMVIGDFNMVLDPILDRLPQGNQRRGLVDSVSLVSWGSWA